MVWCEMQRLQDKNNQIFRGVQVAAAICIICTLVIEFSMDLLLSAFWRSVVIGLDVTLVLGFASYLLQMAILNRSNWTNLLIVERVNLLVLFFAFIMLPIPRLSAAVVALRLLINILFYAMDTSWGKKWVDHVHLRPSQTLALSFLGIISVGTFLLIFPAATVDGKGTHFWDALFTITSAACVVGLNVVDVGTYFSQFGQAVILCTIQVGGLGIMVLSAAFAVLIGTQLHTRRQVGLWAILDVSTSNGLKSLIKAVAAGTFIAEFFGAVFLFFSWGIEFSSFGERVWWSIFHSVSAFCNAGFGLAPNSLMVFVGNSWVCCIIMVLITLGGIGFFVMSDLTNPSVWVVKNPTAIWNRLHVQTRVVIVSTLLLDVVGMLLFLFFEYNGVLLELSIFDKIMASLFQSVSLRTAGFNVVSMGALSSVTVLFSVIWMFIGASPGSTGGGIKTTTLAVALMSVRAMLTGRDEVELMGRRIPSVIVNRSLSIILISAVAIAFILMLMLATQTISFERLLFEVVSAFGTVGLSMDATGELSQLGRFFIITLMYMGRIGPLTLALAIGERMRPKGYQFAEGRLAVG